MLVVAWLLPLLIRAARSRTWSGFGDKTLWDWLQLLIVPLVLVIGGFLLTTLQDSRQRAIEDQRAQDTALQAYLDQMGNLLLEKDLRTSKEDSEVRTLARARTLTILERMDPSRQRQVMQFLSEAVLVQRVEGRQPIISLRQANLSGAELWDIDLSGADLSEADLSGAILRGAKLSGADLGDADLSGANLIEADLTFAIMSGANMSGTYLDKADLSDVNLIETDLSGAVLSGAVLRRAVLSGADLRQTYLNGIDLHGADLSGTDLRDARGVTDERLEEQVLTLQDATMPDGSIHD